MTFEDAAIAVYEEKRAKYRWRQELLDKAAAIRERYEMPASWQHVFETLLLTFWNAETGLCCPDVKTLQKAMRIKWSRHTVHRALNGLEGLGLIRREARRYMKEVIENGRRVKKWVQASNLYHFPLDSAKTFAICADKAARQAAHRAKKAAALLANMKKRIEERTKEKAVRDLFLPSEYHSTTSKPDSYISKAPPTSGGARLEAALSRMALGVGKKNERRQT